MSILAEIKRASIDGTKAIFTSRKMLVMFLLGFSSGLPLMLTLSTLSLWYAAYNIKIEDIGFLSLITFPYTIKFLWSPLMDCFVPPILGRRRGWILLMQCCLMVTIIIISLFSPDKNALFIAILAGLVCFFSASQDIAINAYQADILHEEERALGGAVSVLGFRVAMFTSGTLALIIAAYANWHIAYLSMGLLVAIGMLGVFLAPKTPNITELPKTLSESVWRPFKEFFQRINIRSACLILLIIIIYKLGDALAFSLNSVFFLKGLHFTLVEIGLAYKTNALIATLIGTTIGGLVIRKVGIYKGLLYFSILMACANLMYVLLAMVGKSYWLMSASVATEYFAGGLGTSAFIAFLLSLCHQSYSATQYAIFSSLDSIGRVFIGPFAGLTVANINWTTLFVMSFMIGIVTTIIIYLAKQPICRLAKLHC